MVWMVDGTGPPGFAHVPSAALAIVLDEASTEIAVAAQTNLENRGCVENTREERDAGGLLQRLLDKDPARNEEDVMLITCNNCKACVTYVYVLPFSWICQQRLLP